MGFQSILCRQVEKEKAVEAHRNRHVVNQRYPDVARGEAVVASLAQIILVQYNFNDRGDWLNEHELECCLLYSLHENPIAKIHE